MSQQNKTPRRQEAIDWKKGPMSKTEKRSLLARAIREAKESAANTVRKFRQGQYLSR